MLDFLNNVCNIAKCLRIFLGAEQKRIRGQCCWERQNFRKIFPPNVHLTVLCCA